MANSHPDHDDELIRLRARLAELETELAALRGSGERTRDAGTDNQHQDRDQRFRLMVDNVRGMIVCRGVKGDNKFGYNGDGVSLFGIDTDHISGAVNGGSADIEGWYASIHPEDRLAYVEAEKRRKERCEPYTLEYRFTHPKTRESRWARETAWVVADRTSGATYYDSYILDITEQKRLEQELRRSRRQLERAQRLARMGHWVWRPDKVSGVWASGMEYSPSAGAIFGVSPAELSIPSAELISRFVHPEDQDHVRHEYKNYADRRRSGRPLEYRIVRADGAVRTIVEITEDAIDEETGSRYVIGTIQDVTEQRASEQSQRQSESKLKAFLENVPLAVSIKSTDGRYLMVNRGGAELLDRSPDTVVGRYARDVLPEEILAEIAPLDDEVVRTERTTQGEVCFQSGAQRRWYLATKFPIQDENNAITAIGTFYLDVTEQKAAAEAIREREITIERAQQIARLGHWQWRPGDVDGAGSYIYTQSLAEMVGLSRQELSQLSIDDFIDQLVHPLDRARVRACLDSANRNPATSSVALQYRIQRPDGGVRVVREITERKMSASGKLESMLGTFQDITEQHNIEEALRESQAMMQATIDAIPAIINVKDRNGCYVLVNAYQAAHAGAAAPDIIGRRSIDIYPEEYGRRSAARDRQVLESGKGSGLTEESITNVDGGKTVWLSNRAPIADGAGHVKYIVGVGIDITELKRAEAARLESEVRLRAFMDHAPIAATIKDRDGRYVMVNREAEKLFDASVDRIIGTSSNEVLNEDVAAEAAVLDQKVVQSGEPVSGERHRAGRASYEWTIYTKFPIRDSDGKITGVGAIHVDVGERKRLEAQLTQAQKMEAIGQLTGGIAHDFNNLLGIILGNLELLSEVMTPDERTARFAATAIGAAHRGADLTRRLLAFARRQSLQPRRVAVEELVTGMRDIFQRSLGAPVQIEFALAPSLWPIRADASQLESALLNLALNARDAMPHGGTLTIAARNLPAEEVILTSGLAPGNYVELSVADTGIGIAPENLSRVFEPFFTTKEVGHGSGLGLSMVYGFVRQSGGQVTITSTVDVGTTIRILLPRDETVPIATAASATDETAVPHGSEILLVVEDNDDMRETAVSNLTSLGYRTLEAPDGPTALSILDTKEQIDLLFTDVSLPGGLTGWQIADEARRRRPEIKVLYTSGYPEATAPKSAGGTKRELLKKPYRRNDLAVRLRQVLDNRPN